MQYCNFCGTQLEEGKTCDCQSVGQDLNQSTEQPTEPIDQETQNQNAGQPFTDAQQPSVQQPNVQQPVMQQQGIQQPGAQQPYIQQPIIQQPVMQQPYMQQPVMQQPYIQQPVMQQRYVQQPVMQQPYIQQPVMQQPYMQQQYVQPNPYMQQPYVQTPNMYQKPEIPNKNQPGRKMIKVAGILMVIFGGLGLLMSITSFEDMSYRYDDLRNLAYFEMAVAALLLSYGIAGISLSNKPGKGNAVIGFGVLLLALRVTDLVWGIAILGELSYYMNPSYISGLFIGTAAGCVLPILYIVGGAKKKKTLQG